MALISVREVVTDPDFLDPVVVKRQVQSVDDDGVAVIYETSFNIFASIQSISDNLTVTGDLARTEATYEIITVFPLLTATDSTAADEVLWDGHRFTVTTIGRFGNWAGTSGHYEGTMTLKPTVPHTSVPSFSDPATEEHL
jgi:hypothetical protein